MRPKPAKLTVEPRLRAVVEAKLGLRWSPEQIMGWLPLAYPDDPTMRISHETIALRHCCVDLAALGEMTRRLEDAATAAGPDPSAIRRILNVNGAITDGRSGALCKDRSSSGPTSSPSWWWATASTPFCCGPRATSSCQQLAAETS
jgi:hypothetical protein